ncbi:protein phosphatase 2C domain-containing protein [Desulfoluna spongiiphila]|uniref:protein phosphatase 2C domain-containing protein n=1 Tax=Desulfoluna spongiiphila TaxID=419481 RepID=UPI0012561ACB|nr:PP2C family serine/threonine-protein phosphatase [Desulfoluna spongiiphila]VVS90617.1 protein phosphatase 2c [Desulfoluna spongiiphila]
MFSFLRGDTSLHAAMSDIGKKYTHNEDSFFLPEANATWEISEAAIEASGRLYILCDGMGGGNAGEVASSLAAGWIARDFYAKPLTGREPTERLAALVCETNTALHALATTHEAYKGMGTTLVAAHVRDGAVSLVAIGDSRAYLFRDGDLRQLTEDHSEIWPLYKNGSLTKEELRAHPRSHVLTKALVVTETLTEDDLFMATETLEDGDFLFLCSDGLTDMVPEEEIRGIMAKKKKMVWKAQALVDAANRHGGRDNITVVLVRV